MSPHAERLESLGTLPAPWVRSAALRMVVDNTGEAGAAQSAAPVMRELLANYIRPLVESDNAQHFQDLLEESWPAISDLLSALQRLTDGNQPDRDEAFAQLREAAARFGGPRWASAIDEAERYQRRTNRAIARMEGRRATEDDERARLGRYNLCTALFTVGVLCLHQVVTRANSGVRPRADVLTLIHELLRDSNARAYREARLQVIRWSRERGPRFSGEMDERDRPYVETSITNATELLTAH